MLQFDESACTDLFVRVCVCVCLCVCVCVWCMYSKVQLAKRLVTNSFADKAFFCNTGTEANEGAIKFARKWARVKV